MIVMVVLVMVVMLVPLHHVAAQPPRRLSHLLLLQQGPGQPHGAQGPVHWLRVPGSLLVPLVGGGGLLMGVLAEQRQGGRAPPAPHGPPSGLSRGHPPVVLGRAQQVLVGVLEALPGARGF